MSTQYACPSPKGSNGAGLYLTKGGTLVDKSGRSWGTSSIRRMAQDAAMPGPEWNERSEAVHPRLMKLMAELKSLVEKGGLPPALHKKLTETLARHVGELGRADGAGTTDDEDPDGLAEFRKHLAAKGLNADEIEEACRYAKRDYERGEADDEIPENHVHGGPPIKNRVGSELDLAKEYPGSELVSRDYYGDRPEPDRYGYDPAQRLPGGSVSRRLSNDAALRATDADLAKEYPGIENVRAGAF